MEERIDVKNIGLRGVKVADTRISDVDWGEGSSDLSRFQCG